MSHYKNKKVAIVGLSVEGLDSAVFFAQEGAIVTPLDRRTGPDYLAGLAKFDLVVRTPGMLLATRELAQAKQLTSLTKLFFEECKAPIIGITGTKGKGTTSTLIYEILKGTGKRIWLGGNVGVPLLSKVREISAEDIVVLELSSFQLEDLTQSPHVAVVLPITQEHLANVDPLATNYHVSRDAYIDAKKSIVKFQNKSDFAVVSRDDATSASFGKYSPAKIFYYSRTTPVDAFVQDKKVYLKWNKKTQEICSLSDIQLLGVHNLENIAAAAIVGALYHVPVESIRTVVRSFKGLEHRLEFVRSVGDVSYYNDSFSTVPETAIAAIDSFQKPLILIVGGSEKGSDFTHLGEKIALSSVKTLIVVGDMSKRILQSVEKAGYKGEIITTLRSMHEIVATSAKIAKSGDIVLLSPACASFDMFPNYKERGQLFKYEVSLL